MAQGRYPLEAQGNQANADGHSQEDSEHSDHPQDAHRVVAHSCPDDRIGEAQPISDNTELGAAHTLAVGDGHFDHLDMLVEGAGAHDRGEIEAIGQRIQLSQHLLSEHPHTTGAVTDAVIAQQADQGGEDGVAHTPHQGHLAFGAGHT